MIVVNREPEVGSWKLEVGSWKLEVGSWKLEVGSWKLEVGSWKPTELKPKNRKHSLLSH